MDDVGKRALNSKAKWQGQEKDALWRASFSCSCLGTSRGGRNVLFLSVLLDGQFAAVVPAFGAYVVIHNLGTAIAAGGELRFLQAVVRSSLGRSGL